MTLRIFTSTYGCRDVDRLDITRGGGERARAQGRPVPGIVFAPSLELLRRGQHDRAAAGGDAALQAGAWHRYAAHYRLEMRESYRRHRAAWEELLRRERVVLCCFCSRDDAALGRCHRLLLAEYLVKLGAEYLGELKPDDVVAPPAPGSAA